ncbi:uncharacterized protein LOC134542701 [Bacillus rossius redtenbacheri]|uniref:uncharacterized protein LOC134542701 n=1 Tax=Bacillus rossius redtenbacheri TaxID=93214 RepID=UPI002FDD83BC
MRHKFEENVMVDGDLSKESFFNFLSTQLKRLDQQIVLLSLHKNTLLRKSKSLRAELPNLQEMRKNLFAVDVDIQNISTEQAVKRFEEQEVQIPKRKAMLTQIGKVLRRRAEGLAGTERRLRETEGRLSWGARKLEALRSELRAVEGQETDARAGLERMGRVAGGYRAPPPLDYVRTAEELGRLRRQLAEWRHRKHVQDATLASLEKDVGAAMKKVPEHLRLKFRRMMRGDQVDSPADVDESASPTLLPAPSKPL